MGFVGWVVTMVVIFGGVIVALIWSQAQKREALEDHMADHMAAVSGFVPTHKFMATDGISGIAIDVPNQQVCLLKYRDSHFSHRVLPFSAIISVEIFEDGHSVTKTSRASQAGGALVGGIALGGVGAIIGGLSGKTTTTDKITRIDLRLIVDDMVSPLHDVNIFSMEIQKGSAVHQSIMQSARHWHGLLEVGIRQADKAAAQVHPLAHAQNLTPLQAGSVSDELIKLAELQAQGVLSDDEFKAQKKKLLSAA